MNRRLVFTVSLVSLLVAACTATNSTPGPLAVAPRTAVPTWTLPFSLPTDTPPAVTPELTAQAPTALPTRVRAAIAEPTDPPATAVPPSPTAYVAPRLIVPALDLDRPVVPVLIREGAWEMESLTDDIGWLTTTGQQPGGDLAMTLAGHVNISLGRSGPFLRLGELDPGDPVIYRLQGTDYRYSVVSQTTVKPEEVQALYVPDGDKLLLVTCSSWSYFWGHYARRVIVTTALVSTEPSP